LLSSKTFPLENPFKNLPEVLDQDIDQEVSETVVVFLHAEASDAAQDRASAVLRQSLKHVKWLANKRACKNIVLHSFTHLGGDTAESGFAQTLIATLADRLRETGYQVWITPFGYFCEWDLSVHGESLAKVWKEIH
jgi:hypothetical protein